MHDYTECRSEAAFAELVRRHVEFVVIRPFQARNTLELLDTAPGAPASGPAPLIHDAVYVERK